MFSSAAADAVWETEVLTQGLASAPVEIGDHRIVAVRVTRYEPSHLPNLEQVKSAVVVQLQTQRVKDAAKARGDALLERMRKGEAAAAVAAADQLKWEEFKDVQREDDRINRAVLRAAFKASLEKNDDKTHIGVEYGSGNYAIVEVSSPM